MSKKTIASLTAVLADTYALAVKTHAAHWNVTGSGFFQLHEAFGSQYEALFEAADEVAERIRALGSTAPAGLAAIAKAASVADIDGADGRELAKALRDDHRALSKACAKAAAVAADEGDEGTADLLIGRGQEHDKTAWMLDAYSAK
jgi:starvation-inducible DNA-binding protein